MSTTVGGIRIVDMPDLGVVTDDSSVVGEHAGSGRFGMTALRDYMGGRGIVNVLDHGAKGDGVSDDTAAIQTALNTFAGQAQILIPETSTLYIISSLNLPSNTDLVINGILLQKPHSVAAVLNMTSVSNIRVRGSGTIDGNAAAQIAGGAPGCVSSNGATNLRISDITMQNAFYWPFNITQSIHVLLDHVNILGSNDSPEFATGCDDCWITNSYINGPANDGGLAFYGGATNCGAVGNILTNARHWGISVAADPDQPTPCSNIVISGNVIHNNGFSGIGVLFFGGTSPHTRITISDNILYSNNTRNSEFGSGALAAADIWLDTCSDVVVSGNKCMSCGSGTNGGNGIVVGGSGACHSVIITGNDISNEGQGTHTGVGILIPPACDDLMITGNHIYDNQGSPTMLHGISGVCGARNTITGNHISRMLGKEISLTEQADTIIANALSTGAFYEFGANTTLALSRAQAYLNATSAPRWFAGHDGSTESGSNAGSNYELVSLADNGAVIGTPLTINRATGLVTAAAGVICAGIGYNPMVGNFTNDAGAAAGGIPVGGTYRNGSQLMVRVA